MNTVSIQSQTGDMIYIFVYSSFAVQFQISNGTVSMGERQRIINTEKGSLPAGVTPTHHPISIYIYNRCRG